MVFELLNLPWWWYVLAVLGGLLLGCFFAAIAYFAYIQWQSYKIKKGTPLETPLINIGKGKKKVDKKEISEWLKQPDTIANITQDAGNTVQLTQQEVQEDEQRKSNQYREFEKLRRAAHKKPTAGNKASGATPANSLPGQSSVPQQPSSGTTEPKVGNSGKLKLD